MEPYHWFLLGIMVAWTPGLLILALMLRKRHVKDKQHATFRSANKTPDDLSATPQKLTR